MPYKDPERGKAYRREYYLKHKEKIKKRSKEWAIKNRERYLELRREWYQNNKEKHLDGMRKTRERYLEIYKEREKLYRQSDKRKLSHKRWRDSLRLKVLQGYGGTPPKCACCGEDIYQFLDLDHINNDGWDDRKKGLKGTKLWVWIINNNFPERFQVLCSNCNVGKWRNGGVCPHLQVKS